MNNLFVVEWENGSKKGNCYVRAKDESEAFEKAMYEYFRTVDDIKSVRRVEDESSRIRQDITIGSSLPICHVYYCSAYNFGG